MAVSRGRRNFLAATGAAAIAPGAAPVAQAAAPMRGYQLPFTSVIPLKSAVNGIDYELYVRVPPSYAAGTARYPAVWTLDADYSFAIAANHLEHLADRDHIPAQILVSIAYAGVYPSIDRYHAERTRDYTPVFAPDGGYGPELQKASGGGPKFLEMIRTEAIPMIDQLFRTDPAVRTLVGHSYGGLFASWVLQDHPELFDRYLIVSPSLWYLDEWPIKREAAKQVRPPPRATRVWVGTGSWENQPGRHPMVEQTNRFAALLKQRGDPLLAVEAKIFEDETHASIFPAAFSTGMRHLFPTDWLTAAIRDGTIPDGCAARPGG